MARSDSFSPYSTQSTTTTWHNRQHTQLIPRAPSHGLALSSLRFSQHFCKRFVSSWVDTHRRRHLNRLARGFPRAKIALELCLRIVAVLHGVLAPVRSNAVSLLGKGRGARPMAAAIGVCGGDSSPIRRRRAEIILMDPQVCTVSAFGQGEDGMDDEGQDVGREHASATEPSIE